MTVCLLLFIANLWSPVNFESCNIYSLATLFDGLRPREIFGTIVQLPLRKDYEINLIANIFRVISTFFWLFFYIRKLYK